MALRSFLLDTNAYDMWIAASALRHDLALVTYDRHFGMIPGLVVGKNLRDLLA